MASVPRMEIRRIRDDEVDAVARWIATQQADPARHIGSESMDAGAIATDLRQLEPGGLDDVLVAVDGDDVVGLLALEHDTVPPRVWWRGPYVADGADVDAVADALLAVGRARLPGHVTQEEFGADARHAWLPAFAERHGFVAEEASAVLVRDLGGDADVLRGAAAPPAGVELARVSDATAPAVVALHDAIFPGTHSSGTRIAAPGQDHAVLVASRAGEVVGYVAVERQEDATGYVDYLGVAVGERGTGIGRALVAAGCVWLHDEAGCPSVNLTVRESNRGARRLYESLGFDEERLLRPYRRGFSLAHLDTPPPADPG
ncbi:MAG: GNAT family N-acetyltransferase [Actinobacteria bacterium]|nr:GNAT family N-acetyltransferase [Actinomycetota bacterium]